MPVQVFPGLQVWRLFTYMFLHDVGGFGHIVFNMLALWMFGKDIEPAWGTRRFLNFYFLCGIVSGVCVVVLNLPFGDSSRTLSAPPAPSTACSLAFGMMFPDVTVLFSFLFPIKAKYFVMIIGAIAFLSSFQANTGVSNFAHLGGMVFGFLYMKSSRSKSASRSPYYHQTGHDRGACERATRNGRSSAPSASSKCTYASTGKKGPVDELTPSARPTLPPTATSHKLQTSPIIS